MAFILKGSLAAVVGGCYRKTVWKQWCLGLGDQNRGDKETGPGYILKTESTHFLKDCGVRKSRFQKDSEGLYSENRKNAIVTA